MTKQVAKMEIKTVIDAVREGPKKWGELKKIKVDRRTISDKSLERILKDYLRFWGLVYQNEEDGTWSWFLRRQTFKSRDDYELALRHSGLILFGEDDGTGERTCLGISGGSNIIREFLLERSRQKEFVQHLQTGYPNLYQRFEDFEKLFKKRHRLLKKTVSPDSDFTFEIDVNAFLGDEMSKFLTRTSKTCSDTEQSQKPKPKIRLIEKRLLEIVKEVSGELSVMSLKVRHGTPLEGYCDFCPHISVTIEEGFTQKGK